MSTMVTGKQEVWSLQSEVSAQSGGCLRSNSEPESVWPLWRTKVPDIGRLIELSQSECRSECVMQLKRKVSFASQEGEESRSLPLPTLSRQSSVRRSPSPRKGLVRSPANTTTSPSTSQHQQGLNRNTNNLLELSKMFEQIQSVVTSRGKEIL